jgi:RNA polymerase sigma-70 factor (ECF subfamily)
MGDGDWQAEQFEEHRGHLRAVAYRMLGSVSEADDAVQDAWLRFSRADTEDVENLRGWLTTVVARVCLNMLRARRSRGEQSLDANPRFPDPIVSPQSGPDPQQEALLGDAVGLAMLVVLERLAPAERIAFVLHDVFGVPFDEIAPIVGRSEPAARQLASRGRRRVRGATAGADAAHGADLRHQWRVVDAFLAASRKGDFDALLAVLDPEVVVRADRGAVAPGAPREVHGAAAVAAQALSFRHLASSARRALVNGAPGGVVIRESGPFAVLAFTVRGERIVEIDILADPERLRRLDLTAIE